MDKLILKHEDYSLWKISQENLYAMTEFVVKTNYIKHQNDLFPADIDNEINEIYKSEIKYFKNSLFYALKDNDDKVIGTIRVMKCDRKLLLTLRRLHIDIKEIGKSMVYLGSETCPIFSDTKGLTPFLDENPEYSEKYKKSA